MKHVVGITIAAAVSLVGCQAHAQYAPTFPSYCGECGAHWRRPEYIEVRRERYEPRRRHYRRDDHCRAQLIREGDQHLTEDGARKEAVKAWQQAARWNWGEKYMDVENALGVRYVCSRSSVGSLVGQIFTRCEIRARPCPPDAERD